MKSTKSKTNFACASSRLWSVMVMIWWRILPMSCFLPSPSVPSWMWGTDSPTASCTECPARVIPLRACIIRPWSSMSAAAQSMREREKKSWCSKLLLHPPEKEQVAAGVQYRWWNEVDSARAKYSPGGVFRYYYALISVHTQWLLSASLLRPHGAQPRCWGSLSASHPRQTGTRAPCVHAMSGCKLPVSCWTNSAVGAQPANMCCQLMIQPNPKSLELETCSSFVMQQHDFLFLQDCEESSCVDVRHWTTQVIWKLWSGTPPTLRKGNLWLSQEGSRHLYWASPNL